MHFHFLDFEQAIAELEAEIAELHAVSDVQDVNLSQEIKRLQKKRAELTRSIFAQLTPWQVVQMARHPQRPEASDYIQQLFTDFDELHGDRYFADDQALIGGIARFNDKPVLVLGQQKGRSTKDKLKRNFGMSRPEAYRKALRLMQLAERFKLPIFTFINTPGAYPGIDAEERNQSEAIARNLFVMSQLRTPILCTVIGEGGSGGALAIGVGDWIGMLQYSIYAVISPEGCASILWKSAAKAPEAAAAMGVTAAQLFQLNLIDAIIPEPLGGAHRDPSSMMNTLQKVLAQQFDQLCAEPIDQILARRYERLLQIGLMH